MSYLVLARKWRPSTFKSVVGQEATVQTLTNAIEQDRLHHAYLFSGTHGVGKTTIARLLAKSLSCHEGITIEPCERCEACQQINQGSYPDLIEVDAASRTKVEDTRELLDNVQYMPVSGRFKIYLIDEVHMLSTHSFNALLKTLEEPPSHAKFLLATTDPQKLPVTVLSRCLQFHLKKVPTLLIAEHLAHILTVESIDYEEAGLKLIADAAKGSLRDALSLLDQAIAHGQEQITQQGVQAFLGIAGDEVLIRLMVHLVEHRGDKLLSEVDALDVQGLDFQQLLVEFQRLLHHIAIAQTVPEALSNALLEYDKIMALSAQIKAEDIQLYYQMSLLAQKDFAFAPDPKTAFEMFLLRMLAFQPMQVKESHSIVGSVSHQVDNHKGAIHVPAPTKSPSLGEKKQPEVSQKVDIDIQNSKPVVEKEALPQELSIEDKPQTELERPVAVSLKDNWADIVPVLELKGLAKVIADHCTLVEQKDNQVVLLLDEVQKPLLNKRHESRIQEALSNYLGVSIKLSIQLGCSKEETPAKRVEREKSERQERAEVDIHSDETVKAIKQVFDAEVTDIHVVS